MCTKRAIYRDRVEKKIHFRTYFIYLQSIEFGARGPKGPASVEFERL